MMLIVRVVKSKLKSLLKSSKHLLLIDMHDFCSRIVILLLTEGIWVSLIKDKSMDQQFLFLQVPIFVLPYVVLISLNLHVSQRERPVTNWAQPIKLLALFLCQHILVTITPILVLCLRYLRSIIVLKRGRTELVTRNRYRLSGMIRDLRGRLSILTIQVMIIRIQATKMTLSIQKAF